MIFDCFPFFNELDLLEVRLNELDPVVDKFVLTEASTTFQGEKKPLYFEENKQRYSKFLHKIEHVVVTESPSFFYKFRRPTAWDRSNFQKEQVSRALKHCKPDDVIIFSDIDEIPRANKITEFVDIPGTKVFQQRFYSYYLNCAFSECPEESALFRKDGKVYWRGSVMALYKDVKNIKEFRKRRSKKLQSNTQVEEGGWHFSYLGGLEAVMYKIRSLEHADEPKYMRNYLTDPDAVKHLIESGHDLYGRDNKYAFVDIDQTYPHYILENLDKFSHLIK